MFNINRRRRVETRTTNHDTALIQREARPCDDVLKDNDDLSKYNQTMPGADNGPIPTFDHMPVPLPLNPFRPPSDEYAAYTSCLNLEAIGSSWSMILDEKESSRTAMFQFSPGVVARVLGYALIHSPSTEGKACLAEEISNCNGDNELLAGLSYLYIMAMMRICTFSSHVVQE